MSGCNNVDFFPQRTFWLAAGETECRPLLKLLITRAVYRLKYQIVINGIIVVNSQLIANDRLGIFFTFINMGSAQICFMQVYVYYHRNNPKQ